MSEQNEQKVLDENVRFFGDAYADEEVKATKQYENGQIDRALKALLKLAETSTSVQVRVEAATAVLRFHLASNSKRWE